MARSRYIIPFMAIMAWVIGPQLVQSLNMEYCASINTGTTPTNSSIWQSNGLCHDFCVNQTFAFAIVQHHECWCSNYVPAKADQVDTGKCSDTCPGWKYETCGADDLYGYIALGLAPSGTAGGSPTSSTSTDANTKTTGTTTTAPTTSIKTITAGGTVSLETVTVIPTPGFESGGNTSSSQGLGAGATAGIVIGVLAVVAIIAGIAAFFCLQRRRRQREEQLVSRPHSHLSGSVGVMSTPTTAMASVWDGENTSTGRRSSRLMPHDPRMDPFATNIYSRFENKSRESINTLQDNQDYSRKVLRTTNPDPPDQ
ncbi:hypothetical protein NUW58_g1938 [Xylaria curta]|uniref:Uncharacterized protein n=1 Tax=Xylaria curta TaxID=42375 RepID=A0ACC1PKQ1_9PEZI|nr:hypothetical protein NUW58_g1938 [Xylaria curta]